MTDPTPDRRVPDRTDDPVMSVNGDDHPEGRGFFAGIFKVVGVFLPVVIVFVIGMIVLFIVL